MRFHVPGLPGQPITRENSICAFTQKVRKFALMMEPLGHEVIVYGDPECDPGIEHVPCYHSCQPPPFTADSWRPFNARAREAIKERAEPHDFLCLIGGRAQQPLAEELGDLLAVEFGIGYSGTFAKYRVFESYAWMHTVYGAQVGEPSQTDGNFFDAVIPAYFEADEFPFREEKEDFLLYVGRLTWRKGVRIAENAAQRAGLPLLLAGAGDYAPEYGEVLGPLGPDVRNEVMARARALFCPTIYVEPFGCVAVEAQLCGTPVISTDWGAFSETVRHGVTGFRARTLGEFVWAAEHADELDPRTIRERAVAEFSLEAIAPRYEAYFEQLNLLWRDGWEADWEGLSEAHRYGLLPEGGLP